MKFYCLIAFIISSVNLSAMQQQPWRPKKSPQDYNMRHLSDFIEKSDFEEVRETLSILHEHKYKEILIDKLNTPAINGLTPLHEALTCRSIDDQVIEYLFFYGSDPNVGVSKNTYIKRDGQKIKIYKGWTAAHIAVWFRANEDILSLLKKRGADFTQPDAESWTPLGVANDCRNIKALNFLRPPEVANPEAHDSPLPQKVPEPEPTPLDNDQDNCSLKEYLGYGCGCGLFIISTSFFLFWQALN